ncbi:hypothetical protein ACFQ1S_08450, partial [Kibdelosporangium lantanae]
MSSRRISVAPLFFPDSAKHPYCQDGPWIAATSELSDTPPRNVGPPASPLQVLDAPAISTELGETEETEVWATC